MLRFVGTIHGITPSTLWRSLYSSCTNLFYHAYNVTIPQLQNKQRFSKGYRAIIDDDHYC